MCQSPWKRRRLLSHQGNGALGSSEGLVRRSTHWPIRVQAGSQQGPQTMVYWEISAGTQRLAQPFACPTQPRPHRGTEAPCPCSSYSGSRGRTSRVACSSPLSHLPRAVPASGPGGAGSRPGHTARLRSAGRRAASSGSQRGSEGSRGSALQGRRWAERWGGEGSLPQSLTLGHGRSRCPVPSQLPSHSLEPPKIIAPVWLHITWCQQVPVLGPQATQPPRCPPKSPSCKATHRRSCQLCPSSCGTTG